jgi:hypothetical protein
MLRHSHVPCPPESNETEVSTRYPPCTLLRGLLAGLPKLGSAAAMTTDSKPSKQGSAQPPRKHQPMFGASSSRYRDGWSEDRRLSCLQNGRKVSDVRLLRSEGENSIPRLYPSPRTPVAPSNGLTDAKKSGHEQLHRHKTHQHGVFSKHELLGSRRDVSRTAASLRIRRAVSSSEPFQSVHRDSCKWSLLLTTLKPSVLWLPRLPNPDSSEHSAHARSSFFFPVPTFAVLPLDFNSRNIADWSATQYQCLVLCGRI